MEKRGGRRENFSQTFAKEANIFVCFPVISLAIKRNEREREGGDETGGKMIIIDLGQSRSW